MRKNSCKCNCEFDESDRQGEQNRTSNYYRIQMMRWRVKIKNRRLLTVANIEKLSSNSIINLMELKIPQIPRAFKVIIQEK